MSNTIYFYAFAHINRSRQVLLEELNPLLLRSIHRLLILITRPIAPERKTMDLVLIHLDMRIALPF